MHQTAYPVHFMKLIFDFNLKGLIVILRLLYNHSCHKKLRIHKPLLMLSLI